MLVVELLVTGVVEGGKDHRGEVDESLGEEAESEKRYFDFGYLPR